PDHPMQSALMMKMAWEAAAGGVNVLIDGVGGDEFFTGTYGMASLAARGRIVEAGRRALRHRLPVRTALAEEVLSPLVPERLRLLSRRMRGKAEESKFPAWIDAAKLPASVNEAHDAMSSHPSAWSPQALRQEMWELLQCVSLPHLAWRSRRAYLPFGIEHRSPLWDLRVIEFYLRTPVWVHEDAGRTKAILRSVMQDKVPARVFQRDDKALFDTRLRYGLVDAEARRVEEA